MKLLVLICLLIFSCEEVIADEPYKFLDNKCAPEADFFEITAKTLWNLKAYNKDHPKFKELKDKANLILPKVGSNKFQCNINNLVIDIDVNYRAPQAKGMCGAELRANLTLNLDGKVISKNDLFDSSCFDYSIHSLDFSSLKYDLIKVCGRVNFEAKGVDIQDCADINLNMLSKYKNQQLGSAFKDVINSKYLHKLKS